MSTIHVQLVAELLQGCRHLLAGRYEVAGLPVAKLHVIPQHVDVQQLPHILLALISCSASPCFMSVAVGQVVPSLALSGSTCQALLVITELGTDFTQLLVYTPSFLLTVLTSPDVRDKHLQMLASK